MSPNRRAWVDDNTNARVVGMTGGVAHCDEAAEGVSEHDRLFDAHRAAERDDVISPGVEVPARPVVMAIAATLTAMIEVDHLVGVRETVEVGPERGVIGAGAPMEEQQCWSFDQRSVGWLQAGPGGVEEQTGSAADVDPHDVSRPR